MKKELCYKLNCPLHFRDTCIAILSNNCWYSGVRNNIKISPLSGFEMFIRRQKYQELMREQEKK